jgi:Spy/CpxP family protein refolding chaperone
MKSSMETRMLRAAAVLLCGAGLAMSSAMAQQSAPPPPPDGQMQGPPPGGQWGRGPNAERRVEMLQKRLNLSADQTAQVKAIFEGERGKMEALRANTSLAPQDRRSQMMAIHQDGEAKIQAVLTPDQKTKYEEMQAKERERMQERRQGGGGDGSAPPPPPPQQ